MNEFIINDWYGRLGNNIIQIRNAIHCCKENGGGLVRLPASDVFLSRLINIENSETKDFRKLERRFYYLWNEGIERESRKICRDYIYPLIKKRWGNKEFDLVFHIRGGDCFGTNPHSSYVQCPLSYYKYIIELEKPKTIGIIYEDSTNPAVDFLKINYNVMDVKKDLISDISYILNAKCLAITGISSFSKMLSLCSHKISKVYVPLFKSNPRESFFNRDYFTEKYEIEFNKVVLEIQDYISCAEWSYNEIQKELFLNHNIDCIKKLN